MNVLRRFSIRQVVIGTIGLLSILAVVAIGTLLVVATGSRQVVEQQTERLLLDQDLADRIVRHVEAQLDAAHRYTHDGDPQHFTAFRDEGMAVYDLLSRYRFRSLDQQEKLIVERIRERHETLEVAAQRLFSAGPGTDADTDLPGADLLRRDLQDLLEHRREQDVQILAQQRARGTLLYWVWGGLAMVFGVVFVASAIFLRSRLLEPIDSLTSAVRRVGSGDFAARVQVTGDDELTAVARSVNAMAERLERAREETAQVERRYRDLVEGLSTVVWEAEPHTLACTYVSPLAFSLFGYPPDAWQGTGIWRRVIHPEDYDFVMDTCFEHTRRGQDHVLEYRMVRSDGTIVWVRDFVRVTVDSVNLPVRVRGVITDITESRAAAEALRASEERYHSLFDRVPVGLYRTTPDGELLDANTALAQMVGFASRAELLRDNAYRIYIDDTREAWKRQVEAAEGVIEVVRRQRCRNGDIIHIRDAARAIRGPDGAVLYYEGAIQDVTVQVRAQEALRASEARFRSLIENATDGVVIVSEAGRVLYRSPAVYRILGDLPKAGDGVDLDLIHEEDRAAVRDAFSELRRNAGQPRSVEFRCRHSDGAWRVLHAVGSNLLNDSAVGGYVINMIDVTAHRQLEAQLQHSQKMQAVGRLAGGIAHDFNNLLTAIQGYTDLLHAELPSESRGAADLGEIRRAVETAARLTRQLLAFSRRQVVRPRPTDVGNLVSEMDQMVRRLITEDVVLETSVEPDTWIQADPGQIEQVLLNLIVNARDAVPVSTIRVEVAGVHVQQGMVAELPPGEYVRLSVADDGCGIPADVLPHIFEPFFTTKEVGKGTGIGLATVYGIVHDGGGRVLVESEPGAGTRVDVYLPRISAVPDEGGSSAQQATDADAEPVRVMLVEDEPAVRALAERILRRAGFHVTSAANGVEAMERLRPAPHAVDVLVTDVVMPGMGGVQLAAELLQLRPELPVLFISGYTADMLPAADTRGRPLNFLEKPFSAADFLNAVRRTLEESAPQPV